MKKSVRPAIIMILLMLSYQALLSQIPQERKYDPNNTVKQMLINAVTSKYGTGYKVSFHIMYSLIANSSTDEITDPYGTLKGCILFGAWRDPQEEKERDSIVTGIFKGGQIIWDDYPGTKAGFGGTLLVSRDINNDCEVDIIAPRTDFNLMTREGSGITSLWILSWNGTRGRMINAIHPLTSQSAIITTDDVYKFIDTKEKGVLAIRCLIDDVWQKYFPEYHPKSLPYITYSWNGTNYGYWVKEK